ncbi:hypothetical protein L9F63_002250, partial [Diploptera punctata]
NKPITLNPMQLDTSAAISDIIETGRVLNLRLPYEDQKNSPHNQDIGHKYICPAISDVATGQGLKDMKLPYEVKNTATTLDELIKNEETYEDESLVSLTNLLDL